MTSEEWRAVPGFEGRYEVSDLGRVRSLRDVGHSWDRLRAEPLVLKATPNPKSRYLMVSLRRGGRTFNRLIHVLVLEAFVGARPPGMNGLHWDDEPSNNIPSNLRWGTQRANVEDARRNGRSFAPINPLRGDQVHGAFLTEDDVRCIRAEPHFRYILAMLARAFGISKDHVWKIRRGHMWAHVQ